MLKEIQVSSGGVRGLWIRNDLHTRHHRLLRLEETVRTRKIKLSEEQIQALERFDPEYRERHIQVNATGELVEMQVDLDAYLETYNTRRPHRGRGMEGRTPYTVFKAGIQRKPARRKPSPRKKA